MTLTAPVVIAFSFSKVNPYCIETELLQRGGMTEEAGHLVSSAGNVLDRVLKTDLQHERLADLQSMPWPLLRGALDLAGY